VHRDFIELQSVPEPVLDLIGDPVGAGNVGGTINRNGELGEAPVAGMAGADSVGRNYAAHTFSLPLNGGLIAGTLVHQAGNGASENLVSRAPYK
jgi:hypothetical protein